MPPVVGDGLVVPEDRVAVLEVVHERLQLGTVVRCRACAPSAPAPRRPRSSGRRRPAARSCTRRGARRATWSWLPSAFLVMTSWQAEAGAPMSASVDALEGAQLPPVLDRLEGGGADDQQRDDRRRHRRSRVRGAARALRCFLRICVDDRLAVGLRGLLGHGSVPRGRARGAQGLPPGARRRFVSVRGQSLRTGGTRTQTAGRRSRRRAPSRGRRPARRPRTASVSRGQAEHVLALGGDVQPRPERGPQRVDQLAGGRGGAEQPGRPGPRPARGRRPRGSRTRTGPPRRRAPAPRRRGRRRSGGQHQVGAGRGRRRTGRPPSLPCAELGGPGDLVGDRRRGHRQRVAVGVGAARRSPRATRTPAAPIAMSVWPSRQARPAVSVTTTRDVDARTMPDAAAQGARRGVGVLGQQHHRARPRCWRRRCPAAAMVRPWRVRTIVVAPRRATTRAVSPGSASSRVPGRTRPSALLTTLLVTTTTSPSTRSTSGEEQGGEVVAADGPRGPRRGRGPRGSPPRAALDEAYARPGPSRPWRRGRSSSAAPPAQAMPGVGQPGDLGGVPLVDQPAVEDAAVGPAAVVQPHPGGADLDADRGEHLLGHAAHVGAADDGGEADHGGGGRGAGPRGPGAPRGWCRPTPPGSTAAAPPGRRR